MNPEYFIAKALATIGHKGQFRRDGITPYITHPLTVADNVSERAKPAAILHDLLEDQDRITEQDLRLVLSEATVDAVVLLTKKKAMIILNT